MFPSSLEVRARPFNPVVANKNIDHGWIKNWGHKKQEQWKTHFIHSGGNHVHVSGIDVLSSMSWQQYYNLQLPNSRSSSGSAPSWLGSVALIFGFNYESLVILCFRSFSDFSSLVSAMILWIIQHNLNKLFFYLIQTDFTSIVWLLSSLI